MPICKYEEFLLSIKHKNRILGIDHGTKKIGIAISDSDLIVATPLTTIIKKKQFQDFNHLSKIISEFSINGLVFGWPLNMDGSYGARCQSVETFVKKYLNFCDIPVFFQDERMSTQAVKKIFIAQNLSRKKRYKYLDEHAACWILQSALDTFNK